MDTPDQIDVSRSRLGSLGIAIAILVVIALILAALFCAFPWSMTLGRHAAALE